MHNDNFKEKKKEPVPERPPLVVGDKGGSRLLFAQPFPVLKLNASSNSFELLGVTDFRRYSYLKNGTTGHLSLERLTVIVCNVKN